MAQARVGHWSAGRQKAWSLLNRQTGGELLRKGDLVEVRGADEIVATLDERGELEDLPFMPEMVAHCGRRFTVAARAERVCDTIYWSGSRCIPDAVLLEDLRCDGSGHRGCAAECRIYWKEAWLKRVTASELPAARRDEASESALLARIAANATYMGDDDKQRYRCQATEAFAASISVSPKDARSYLRQYTTGNVSLPHFTRVMGRAVAVESARKLHLSSEPSVRGSGPSSPRTPALDLQPGEWVCVKSREDIAATLNDKGKNKGLWFDREMLAFCGKQFQVRQRITRLVDDRTGEMVELTSDCVTLDGAVCSGENSPARWFCPRAIYPYWREGWLERVERPAAGPAAAEP